MLYDVDSYLLNLNRFYCFYCMAIIFIHVLRLLIHFISCDFLRTFPFIALSFIYSVKHFVPLATKCHAWRNVEQRLLLH